DFDTDDQSRNNLFLSIITLGEGWHNNHHYYAGSTRQGFYWWQIDVTYYLLKIMSWLGIVWGLKPIPKRVYDVSKIAQARKQRKVAKTGAPTIHSKESP
ncbi:MAG: acyl-CoA desaturase, partial [Acinetobacter sp.]